MERSATRFIPVQDSILLLDEIEISGRQLRTVLGQSGRDIRLCRTLREALALLQDWTPDLIVTSLDLPDAPGLRVLEVLRERHRVPVLALANAPATELVVGAMRNGALDVLARPINARQVAVALERTLDETRGERELNRARARTGDPDGLGQLLTRSPRMLRVFDQIRAVAATDATALILGETGTGKELVSRAIHERSRRRDRPFIGVNCGAFTESLLESELFGHEKGSFTGAAGRRQGVFELANGGTLFLDELGETSLNVQVNLLRVLEEMRFRRVGGHDFVQVDVRIVAATNAPLEEAVRKSRFREDLYYRLNVFPIQLPPLRERAEDIPILARHFLQAAAEEYELEAPVLTPEVEGAMQTYRWPGNVRQLRAMCERWVIVAGGREVGIDLMPGDLRTNTSPSIPSAVSVADDVPMKDAIERATEQIERAYLDKLLRRNGGHLQRTANAAGITRRTLYTKMKAYGLDAGDYRAR